MKEVCEQEKIYWEEKTNQLISERAHININGNLFPKKDIEAYQYFNGELKVLTINHWENDIIFNKELFNDEELMMKLVNETVSNWKEDYLVELKEILILKYFIKLTEIISDEIHITNNWGFTNLGYEDLFEEFCSINRRLNFRLKMDNLKENKVIIETKHSDENIKVKNKTLELIYKWKDIKKYYIDNYTDWNKGEE